jgi:hypothetical protein
MGDRDDRARAWRGFSAGILLTLLSLVATAAVAVAIPTEGENPHAWGVVLCGAVTIALCVQLAWSNRQRLRHYTGADLPPAGPSRRSGRFGPPADASRLHLPSIRRS